MANRYRKNGQAADAAEVAGDLGEALERLVELAEGGANRIYQNEGACIGCGRGRHLSHEPGCAVLECRQIATYAGEHLDWLERK